MIRTPVLITALIAALAAGAIGWTAVTATPARTPAPVVLQDAPAGRQVAVLAGGCFWGMEGMFEHVKGVQSVTSGYAGGTAATANYGAVSSETSNHAEAIRIVYDPAVITYAQLLDVYFRVAHDPTQVNGQYPDTGTSYRSAIFPQNPAQQQAAGATIANLGRTDAFARPIATRIEAGAFYPAEPSHQHFMQRNPTHPYIVQWDLPKLAALRKQFPSLYRS